MPTTTQRELFGTAIKPQQSLQEAKPGLCKEFCRIALVEAAKGKTYLEAKWVAAEIRRSFNYQNRDDKYKVNNNEVPALARLAMARHPELVGLFRLRGEKDD